MSDLLAHDDVHDDMHLALSMRCGTSAIVRIRKGRRAVPFIATIVDVDSHRVWLRVWGMPSPRAVDLRRVVGVHDALVRTWVGMMRVVALQRVGAARGLLP